MVENYPPPPTYFILLLITITRLISTVGNKTEEQSPKLDNLNLLLRYDPESLQSASKDFGNIVHNSPRAVFFPKSAQDIARLVRASYESPVPFQVAARGQGHSMRGQAMARDGVVVEMKALREERNGVGVIVVGCGRSNNKNKNKNELYYYADVGGEELWADVLYKTVEHHGLAPTSWTDYLYLTVGGTLSNAGISGQTFRYGPQITIVSEMDVITGKGEVVTCSENKNSELFHAVLGGLGQFGIITRARIALEPAPKRVKWVRVLYNDFSAFTRDQERLITMNNNGERKEQNMALDYVEGMLLMNQGPINNWRSSFFPLADHHRIISLVTQHSILYCLEFAKYYYHHQNSENNVDKELQSLIQGLSYVPGFYYEKNVTYVEFLNRVRNGELKLQSQGLWDVPHPWLNLFIPKSQIMDFDSGVFRNIIFKRNITTGPVLIYPMNRNKWDNRMSASIPDEDIFYTVGFLQSSDIDNWKEFDAQNKEIMKFCNDVGIKVKQYLPHYSTQEDWTKHFGPKKWKTFLERKHQFDPRMILSPGQRIFTNNYIYSF